jgi:rare lipoprotein A
MVKKFLLATVIILISLLSACVPKQSVQTSNQTYRVHGKQYHVLSSSKNYEEQGLASWYGRDFQRKRTTSGERYNMYGMTAAHKTLPLSTYVLVTNLFNGKHVVVRVNDRGPFVSNRVIDLSYAAAKKLGMVGMGTARVDVKAIA